MMEAKSAMMAMMEALEMQMKKEILPERTLYLAFCHNHQIDSSGASAQIAATFKKAGIEFEAVIGPESYIYKDLCMNLKRSIAFVSCAERMEVKLQLRSENLEALTDQVTTLKNAQFPIAWKGEASSQLLNTLIPELPFGQKWRLCNRSWLLWALPNPLKGDVILENMLYSPVEVISMEQPEGKAAVANLHWNLAPDYSLTELKEMVLPKIGVTQAQWSPDMKIKQAASAAKGYAYEVIQTTLKQVLGDILVMPGIQPKETNLQHFQGLSANLYHITPWELDAESLARLESGIDNRITIEQYLQGIRFYYQLFENILL